MSIVVVGKYWFEVGIAWGHTSLVDSLIPKIDWYISSLIYILVPAWYLPNTDFSTCNKLSFAIVQNNFQQWKSKILYYYYYYYYSGSNLVFHEGLSLPLLWNSLLLCHPCIWWEPGLWVQLPKGWEGAWIQGGGWLFFICKICILSNKFLAFQVRFKQAREKLLVVCCLFLFLSRHQNTGRNREILRTMRETSEP